MTRKDIQLAQKACVPCRGGVPPLNAGQIAPLVKQLDSAWEPVENQRLRRTYAFGNFAEALAFTNRIGALAEEQQHHPDIYLAWGKVRIEIWTHKIGGLTESDFIFAAKCDALALSDAMLFTDGGSRGNPGPAASGAVLLSADGAIVREVGLYLGTATNNVAEWTALLVGLEAALEMGIRNLNVRMDSELVVKQLSGEYRVKHPDLQPLHRKVVALLRRFEHVDVRHVGRKDNALADAVVNRVLDQEASAASP